LAHAGSSRPDAGACTFLPDFCREEDPWNSVCLQDSGTWKDSSVFRIIAIAYTIPLVVEQRKLEGPSCLQSRGCSIYLAAEPHVVC
jgi:hypothetical protein